MGLETAAARLAWARKRHGQYRSGSAAARAFGWVISTYLGHENGDRIPSIDMARRYARAYRVRWEWLLEGEGEPEMRSEAHIVSVPLISWVSAGRLADPGAPYPVEDIPLLAFADLGPGDWFALRVDGDSMDRVSPSGSIIVVNRADRELLTGKAYVFCVRGDTTFKRWNAEPACLLPYSTNPEHVPMFVRRTRDLEVVGRVRRTLLDL